MVGSLYPLLRSVHRIASFEIFLCNVWVELLGKRYSLFKDNMKIDVTPVVIGGDDGLED